MEKQDQQEKKKTPTVYKILIGVFSLVVIIIIMASWDSSKDMQEDMKEKIKENEGAITRAEKFLAEKEEEIKGVHFKDGVYVVGEDIEPGIYRTRKGSSNCYYSRLSGFEGTLDEIIANENATFPAVVEISPTDKGFKSSGCGVWTQDLSAITDNKNSFGDGIFMINTDIEPGTYKSSGGSSCYYSRLSGFGGTMNEIIANENTDTSAIVTILSTDKGFKSSGCGTWSKK